MASFKDIKDSTSVTDRAMLNLLSAVESEKQHSQRSLSQRIGVALGLTNSLMKRAVNKGLIKIKEAPTRRYAYYITPKGFNEKSRLVADYLSSSLSFFRQAREEFDQLCEQMERDQRKRVVLYGAGELAEIAILSLQQSDVEILGVIEPGSNQSHVAGLPVYASVENTLADGVDGVVLSAANNPQESYDQLVRHVDADSIYVVPLLHVTLQGNEGDA